MIGSNSITEVKGKKVRARVYPWGIIEGLLSLLVIFYTFNLYYRESDTPKGSGHR